MRSAALPALALLLSGTGCLTVGYEGALGYRSRQAALQSDAKAFGALMEEAAEAEPKSRLDNPKKTVLTHFLELAEDPLYLSTVEGWRARGWVDEDMICPVYRAHFAAHHATDPEAAARSAEVCLARARAAAERPDRGWELDLCLLESPVFVETSTASLQPYLDLAADPEEPEALRAGLLKALTFRERFGPRQRYGVAETRSPAERRELARREAEAWRGRLRWVLEALAPRVDPTSLAIASARGVFEVEHVLSGFQRSFVAAYADSAEPARRAWAWGWVRALKAADQVDHLGGLGLWDSAREPAGDAFWYLCHGPPPPPASGPLGPRVVVKARTVRAKARLEAPSSALAEVCADHPAILGPYPLEQIARTVAAERLRADAAAKVVVRVKKRTTLEP